MRMTFLHIKKRELLKQKEVSNENKRDDVVIILPLLNKNES